MAEPVLIDLEVAIVWSGRPQRTLLRWANEGRITRYENGTGSRKRTFYNLNELNPATEDGPGDAPPFMEEQATDGREEVEVRHAPVQEAV